MYPKKKNNFYGRRKGRKISFAKLNLEEDYRYKFYLQENQINKLKFNKYFRNILEIGFGSGENLVNMSLNKPNDLFIGCDAYRNGCIKLLRQIVDKNSTTTIKRENTHYYNDYYNLSENILIEEFPDNEQ